jgi:hypothetical protein
MKMVNVNSSAVQAIGHEGSTMHVTFNGGKTYEYKGIAKGDFDFLVSSKSIGSTLHKMGIKGIHIKK